MIFTARIHNAIKLASHLHRNQTRKDNNRTPYISHLASVAMILRDVTEDEDIIIAGLMHDSLEDVPLYTYGKLVVDCGERVATIVSGVTEPLDANKEDDEQLPWMTRKEEYLKRLDNAGTESAMVSCADKIHNTESFIIDVADEGEVFLKRFAESLRNKMWFQDECIKILQEKLGKEHTLIQRLLVCTEEMRKIIPSA